jgi:S1-C subfamily serine protease
MRRIDWIMIIALAVLALGGKLANFGESSINPQTPQNPRRPSPQVFSDKFWGAETQNWLSQNPQKSRKFNLAFSQLPKVGTIQQNTERASSVGTAFSILKRDLWLTVKHVVAGCDKAYVQTGNKKIHNITNINFHPNADITLLTTRGAPASLNLLKS